MPDYPYIYPEGPPRALEPGGTRIRVHRRRPRREGESRAQEPTDEERDSAWRELLESAVSELNAIFRKSGTPHSCHLHEDGSGFLLRVTTAPSGPQGPDEPGEVEEVLEAADLPEWLARLRAHLGILVDEKI